MKKYLLLLFIVPMFFLFVGCALSLNKNENYISDIRYGIFDGECEKYSITFVYGLRENPYYPDGVANEKVEFGIISVIFQEKIEDNETVYYSLKINDNVITGTLEKSPYTNQYMADIGKICENTDTLVLDVYFESDTTSTPLNLTNKNKDWDLDYNDAFSNGTTALSNEIKEFIKNEKSYEIQVKILNEQQTNFGVYFWSVTIISSSGDKHNVVFGTDSTDILVKN
ncbi:MAG: hypothetical protein PHS54_04070 [Clostridia bacterium]|nr:hypothetical protein [Clostridia bacterium]